MNIIEFNYTQIKSRPLSSILNIILFAAGVAIISLVFLLRDTFENQIEKNAKGIDLVVGAKGSPLQLILSGIYHIDYPTGNINYNEAMQLAKNPLIKKAIPLALGDNYSGFRIVGTDKSYPDIYAARIKLGYLWSKDFEATLGSRVASKTGIKLGTQFAGVHGLAGESDHLHKEQPYTVTGIFEETGTVLDQLILTNVGSVWKIHEYHEHEGSGEHEDHKHDKGDCQHHEENEASHKEITSLLIQYQNPMGAITLPRLVNKSTNMQAASPVHEMNRLYSLLGVGVEALTYISVLIIAISALSIFVSMLNSLKDRKYELALIRVMGGSRFRLFAILILEGISFAFVGYILGFIIAVLYNSPYLPTQILILITEYPNGLVAWIYTYLLHHL